MAELEAPVSGMFLFWAFVAQLHSVKVSYRLVIWLHSQLVEHIQFRNYGNPTFTINFSLPCIINLLFDVPFP